MPDDNYPEVIQILIFSTALVLLLGIIIVFSLFINQKRKYLHRRQLDQMKNEFDNEILKTQLEIQSQTFETVSLELHDNVSNTISLALLNLNLIQKSDSTFNDLKIQEAKELMLEAKKSVKDFSWYINPANINKLGIQKSLAELIERFKNLINIEFKITGIEFSVDAAKHIIIYRIVQEALTNIVKHAQCGHAIVQLKFETGYLLIMIQDDGRGFNASQPVNIAGNNKSSGIGNMISRAAMIGAELAIESLQGKGTSIRLNYRIEEN
jgi:signal transduction histidine kinase